MIEWIDVNDRLPDDNGKRYGVKVLAVIIFYCEGSKPRRYTSDIVYKDGAFRHNWYAGSIEVHSQVCTHWMYWPELPKIKGKLPEFKKHNA